MIRRSFLDLPAHKGERAVKTSDAGSQGGVFLSVYLVQHFSTCLMVMFGRFLCVNSSKSRIFKLNWSFLNLVAHRGELAVNTNTTKIGSAGGDFYLSV